MKVGLGNQCVLSYVSLYPYLLSYNIHSPLGGGLCWVYATSTLSRPSKSPRMLARAPQDSRVPLFV
jgi:hypothetical protein